MPDDSDTPTDQHDNRGDVSVQHLQRLMALRDAAIAHPVSGFAGLAPRAEQDASPEDEDDGDLPSHGSPASDS